ncbi:MAG: hypothetical protein MUF54_17520 [Polyangiaceae bacterium]|nr:hypothetical protein [Polyangiaceae bacterium]
MRRLERLIKLLILFVAFGISTYFALQFRSNGLWHGIEAALAVGKSSARDTRAPYDLTKLEAVTATIRTIRDKYVEPQRVKPRDMLSRRCRAPGTCRPTCARSSRSCSNT